MTHDELLAKINSTPHQRFASEENAKRRDALRAVVELHKPTTYGTCTYCNWGCHSRSGIRCDDSEACRAGGYAYPCPTIQAIQEQLK